ncbi:MULTISPECIES: hypothetical protein [Alteromonas]|uniref:Uncharacterized protein n=1 Tax=Alteromonas stellipolaris TaxID=233316 RepID=A0AAW7Z1S4_9ALTE|nr:MULTISPECIES: hypothetical protein [Alteromonas]AMJ87031.1 hypothetical protein AV939_10895 [Alteromonas sp. Mac1]AMJ90892.1 hypothetical protein AV940_10665 [Alteromonas sp. Mac2]MDO6576197.1 hypothetical protein [Alteromonas stellipolaris]
MISWLNSNPSVISFITLSIIFIGWSVVFQNSKRITDRNETYNILRSLIDKLEKIVNEGTNFWLNPSSNNLENIAQTKVFLNYIAHIKSDLKLLELRKITIIKNKNLVIIRSSLTLNAESANNLDLEERSEKIEDLAEAIESLKMECYSKYMKLYPLTDK